MRFHSLSVHQVYRQVPTIAPSRPWLGPLRPVAPAAGQLFTVEATDGLYLLDYLLKTELHQQTDSLLLGDSAFIQALRQLYAVDQIFTSDSRVMMREHRQSDGVYLLDLITKTVLFLLKDDLYLLDTATTEKIAGALSFLFTDYLLLGDVAIKTEMHRQTEGVYVSDARTSTLLKHLLDTLYVLDRRYSLAEMGTQDALLLNEFTTKFLHAIRADGLYLSDDSVQQLFAAAVAMISYVRLQSLDPIGGLPRAQDALSVRAAVRDFLGVVLQTIKPRVH